MVQGLHDRPHERARSLLSRLSSLGRKFFTWGREHETAVIAGCGIGVIAVGIAFAFLVGGGGDSPAKDTDVESRRPVDFTSGMDFGAAAPDGTTPQTTGGAQTGTSSASGTTSSSAGVGSASTSGDGESGEPATTAPQSNPPAVPFEGFEVSGVTDDTFYGDGEVVTITMRACNTAGYVHEHAFSNGAVFKPEVVDVDTGGVVVSGGWVYTQALWNYAFQPGECIEQVFQWSQTGPTFDPSEQGPLPNGAYEIRTTYLGTEAGAPGPAVTSATFFLN